MLVLSIKPNGKAVLTDKSGQRIEVTNLSPIRAKFGFNAPADVRVLRGEIDERKDGTR